MLRRSVEDFIALPVTFLKDRIRIIFYRNLVKKIGVKQLLRVDESWLNAGLDEFSERVGNIRDFCTKIINGENRLKEYLDYCQNLGEQTYVDNGKI